ncbi:MAG: redoxin domain-containing protein [Pseudohongiellaceae bacterium]
MKLASKLVMACILTSVSVFTAADEYLRSIPEFELTDHLGDTHSLDQYQDNEYLVFYVQGVGCPIARIALPSLREARDEFEDDGIKFLAFNASIQDDIPRIKQEAEEFGIDFPILRDEGQHLAKALGVERTAEVFIVDPRSRDVLFRGPINDQLGYETQRVSASEHYLKDALNTLLAGGTVNMDDIPDSKGCLIAIFDS